MNVFVLFCGWAGDYCFAFWWSLPDGRRLGEKCAVCDYVLEGQGGGGEWGGVFKRPDYDRKTAADLS